MLWMKLRLALARWLDPESERMKRRFWHLWHEIDNVNKWCDGEARHVTRYLIERDGGYARREDDPPHKDEIPAYNVGDFRTWLYSQRS